MIKKPGSRPRGQPRHPREKSRQARSWAVGKLSALDDPEVQRLYLAYDGAFDWDPADPRLEELADALLAIAGRYSTDPGGTPPEDMLDEPAAIVQLWSQNNAMPSSS